MGQKEENGLQYKAKSGIKGKQGVLGEGGQGKDVKRRRNKHTYLEQPCPDDEKALSLLSLCFFEMT